MSLQTDSRRALQLLEKLQEKLGEGGGDSPTSNTDLSNLIYILDSPLFSQLLNIQDSLQHLKALQLQQPLSGNDFDFDPSTGELVLGQELQALDRRPDTLQLTTQVGGGHGMVTHADLHHVSPPVSPVSTAAAVTPQSPVRQKATESALEQSAWGQDNEFCDIITHVAEGRDVETIILEKAENSSLGFSVVGLKSENRGELGIFVQSLQPGGLAARDGRLQENDKILAINGRVLESTISHQQAIHILQNARGHVELVVGRGRPPPLAAPAPTPTTPAPTPDSPPSAPVTPGGGGGGDDRASVVAALDRTPSAVSDTSDMLSTEWVQLEVIELYNDGSGLGFGIIGGKSTGVVVKTILPGGVADRDGHLRSGDHILQIGEVNVRGMGSEQVACVLRQSGALVRLIVARSVAEPEEIPQTSSMAPVIPTVQLEEHLHNLNEAILAMEQHIANGGGQNGDMEHSGEDSEHNNMTSSSMGIIEQLDPMGRPTGIIGQIHTNGGEDEMELFDVELVKDNAGLGVTIAGYVGEKPDELSGIFVRSIADGSAAALDGRVNVNDQVIAVDNESLEGFSNQQAVDVLRNTGQIVRLKLARYKHGPRYEQLLKYARQARQPIRQERSKDHSPDLVPIFIPPPGITTHNSLHNHMTHSGHMTSQGKTLPGGTNMSWPRPFVIDESDQWGDSRLVCAFVQEDAGMLLAGQDGASLALDDIQLGQGEDFSGELTGEVEEAIKTHWQFVVGDKYDIIVAQLCKFKEGGGLGISLEGTVDVENGVEVRPHHYIRSVLEDGPVGINGKLEGGDELLEVNNQRLLGLNHKDVVKVLKDLPQYVRIVCARPRKTPPAQPITTDFYAQAPASNTPFQPPSPVAATTADISVTSSGFSLSSSAAVPAPSATANAPWGVVDLTTHGTGHNYPGANDGLVKAKSEQLLPVTETSTEAPLSRLKSRSLEPLTGYAMWSSEATVIDLQKGDRGLGFSILDYQDPVNPDETVIVIRSLVPGGIAQMDGRLVPGDRLLFVNDIHLENASLDQAVQALKGASRGLVHIGVVKPLPMPEIGESSTDDFIPEMEMPTLADTAPTLSQMAPSGAVHDSYRAPPQLPSIPPPHSPPPTLPRQASITMETQESQERTKDEPKINTVERLTRKAKAAETRMERLLAPSSESVAALSKRSLEDQESLSSIQDTSHALKEEWLASPASRPCLDAPHPSPQPVYKRPRSLDKSESFSSSTSSIGGAVTPAARSPRSPSSTVGSPRLGTSALYYAQNRIASPTGDVHSATPSPRRGTTPDPTMGHAAYAPTSSTFSSSDLPPPLLSPSMTSSTSSREGLDQPDRNLTDPYAISPITGKPRPKLPPKPKSPKSAFKDEKQKIVSITVSDVTGSQDNDTPPSHTPPPVPSYPPPPLTDWGAQPTAQPMDTDPPWSDSLPPYIPPTPVTSSDLRSVSASVVSPPPPTSPVPSASPSLSPGSWGAALPITLAMPTSLERTIRIKKGIDQLGLTVESSNQGVNGCVVKSIILGSAVGKDGRIQVGDYIIVINNESLRRITNAQARAILRRASLLSTDISITYISAVEATVHSEAAVLLKDHQGAAPVPSQLSPNSSLASPGSQTSEQSLLHSSDSGRSAPTSPQHASTTSPSSSPTTTTHTHTSPVLSPARSLPSPLKSLSLVSSSQVPTTSSSSSETSASASLTSSFVTADSSIISMGAQNNLAVTPSSSAPAVSPSVAQSWGSPRRVEIHRKEGENLGINIIAGRVDHFNVSPDCQEAISGIFINHVLDSSPAGREKLKTGDRILEVDGVDLREATHDEAVSVIRHATTPVTFCLQSLTEPQWSSFRETPERQSPKVSPTDASSQVSKTTEVMAADYDSEEEEDEFGYTFKKILKSYGELQGQLHLVELGRASNGLGLSLAGNRDLATMSVFVVGISVDSPAGKDGRIRVGDELLEINGQVLYGRCHQNASAIIKSITASRLKIILLRRDNYTEHMAVKPQRKLRIEYRDDPNTLIPKKSKTEAVVAVTHDVTMEEAEEEETEPPTTNGTDEPSPLSSDNHMEESPSEIAAEVMPSTENGQAVNLSGFSNVSTVSLTKANQGLGFQIVEGNAEGEEGIYVKTITPAGPADQEGTISLGDRVLTVNGQSLVSSSYDMAIEQLRNIPQGAVHVSVQKCRSRTPLPPASSIPAAKDQPPTATDVDISKAQAQDTSSPPPRSLSPPPSSPPPLSSSPPPADLPPVEDPATCAITPGQETTIEIQKGKTGLGLSIVGGADTLLGAIIVHEVYDDGAAAKDGRLWAGDQILEVNSADLRAATHDRAIQVLRQTQAIVTMLVYRDETLLKEDDMYDVITVDLNKKHGKGLGLSIVGKKNDKGVYVSDIVKGGVSEADGRLMQGDQILTVNGKDLRTYTQEDAAGLLKTLMGRVTMTVGRLRAGSSCSSRRSSSQSGHSERGLKKSDSSASNKSKGKHGKTPSLNEEASQSGVTLVSYTRRGVSGDSTRSGEVEVVQIARDAGGSLGLSIAGGVASPHGDLPIFVAGLNPLGAAARSGKVKVGDQILSISGHSLEGLSHSETVQLLKGLQGPISMVIVHGEDFALSSPEKSPPPLSSPPGGAPLGSHAPLVSQDSGGQLGILRELTLQRTSDGLGFSIVGGFGSQHGDLPIYVKNVYPQGAASREGSLKRGDQLVTVNSHSLEGMTHEEAVDVLTHSTGTVQMTILS